MTPREPEGERGLEERVSGVESRDVLLTLYAWAIAMSLMNGDWLALGFLLVWPAMLTGLRATMVWARR